MLGKINLVTGLHNWLSGMWDEAVPQFDQSIEHFHRSPGRRWDALYAHSRNADALFYLGRFDEIERRVFKLYDQARAMNDRYAMMELVSSHSSIAWLIRDQAEQHLGLLESVCNFDANVRDFQPLHFLAWKAKIYSLLYLGRPQEADDLVKRIRRLFRKSPVHTNQLWRSEFAFLCALTQLALSSAVPAPIVHLKKARAAARQMRAEGLPAFASLANIIEAVVLTRDSGVQGADHLMNAAARCEEQQPRRIRGCREVSRQSIQRREWSIIGSRRSKRLRIRRPDTCKKPNVSASHTPAGVVGKHGLLWASFRSNLSPADPHCACRHHRESCDGRGRTWRRC